MTETILSIQRKAKTKAERRKACVSCRAFAGIIKLVDRQESTEITSGFPFKRSKNFIGGGVLFDSGWTTIITGHLPKALKFLVSSF